MCNGESNRPTFGGTIAVMSSDRLESSRSSSPDSIASSSSSTLSMSSYSLFFRNSDEHNRHTKAIFQIDDAQTYHALRSSREVYMRVEKYGDLSNREAVPLHRFAMDFSKLPHRFQPNFEFELPETLELGVSEKGVIGRQLSMMDECGCLALGIIGYN
ncbi:hypothetical protein N7466_003034 [Penicillium verhagenii]|uniref:uncharacterized protein n=1 Tax=Penicillium verhagenii TaxID=1562060 RepID=UPI0025459A4E|nr:uncharacterized protein N7466_003034 [Penicillium verhagenii]KAJ5936584.1 hypothetical protein N7466_003034 [Penicillium verhagenii]